MRCLILVFSLLLIAFGSHCQENSIEGNTNKLSFITTNKKSKALVIGVSNYQNIRSLNFADKDATEFASFLKTNKGWKIEEENILLLTNESAKQGDILMGLQWLLDISKEGEEVIFYFSGHGDVETVGEQKKGFLLAYDSPKNNYPLGGTIEVELLDSVFSELIARNIKVTMIIDACRSGNLAGGMSGKSQTTEALAHRWKNEVRILSAQPDQLSYENEKWGGGRGVFSYFLVKGLTGYADADGDVKIKLNELEQYIGNNISIQTNYTQQPIIDGPNKYSLVVSQKDEEQMSFYNNDLLTDEFNVTLASTKAGDEIFTESCLPIATELNRLLSDGLKIDSFLLVEKNWKQLKNCTSPNEPLQLKYKYLRSIINEINRVVQLSLTGEKLGIDTELSYALQLIEELEEINKGKKFVGQEHFKLVSDYLKSVRFGSYSNDFLSNNKYDYTISFEGVNEELDSSEIDDNLREYGLYEVELLQVDTSNNQTRIKLKTDLDGVFEALWAIDYFLSGKVQLHVNIYNDSLFIGEATYPKGKFDKNINYWNYEKKYAQFLLEKLNVDISLEPNSAYLYYAKALLFKSLNEKDSTIQMLEKTLKESPKWLVPRYLLGLAMQENKDETAAISHFEGILDLDSTYLDFQCTDCFYMGLIDLYLKTKQKEKIDPVLQKWLKSKSVNSLEIAYKNLFGYSEKRKFKKYWFSQFQLLPISDFNSQIDIIMMSNQLKIKKNQNKEVIELVHNFLTLEQSSNLNDFLQNPKRLSSFKIESELIREFFTENRIYDTCPRELFFENMDYLIGSCYEHFYFSGKAKEILVKEDFLLSGINRLESASNYAYWIELVDILIQRSIRANDIYNWKDWLMYQDKEVGPELFSSIFAIDKVEFDKYYSGYFDQEFYENFFNLFIGEEFIKSAEYKKLKEKIVSFEDYEKLKFIEETLKKNNLEFY